MKYENFVVTDGVEYCDHAFLCVTGSACSVEGLYFDLEGGPDFSEEIIIGAIDAPDRVPAGGWEFDDCFLGPYIQQQIVAREK
jgi:hypothetical protein